MQSLNLHVQKTDLHIYEATPKFLKNIIQGGVKSASVLGDISQLQSIHIKNEQKIPKCGSNKCGCSWYASHMPQMKNNL